jgi:hypothetical protein
VYDTLNRLQTLTPPAAIGAGNFGFGYDPLSRRTSPTRPNSVNTRYGYDNLSPIRFDIGPNFYRYVANDPVRQIDPSGLQQQGAPVYNPLPWNDSGTTHTNNCYSYACNVLHPPGPWSKPQPGGDPYFSPQNCLDIKSAARADGLKNGTNGQCPCGYYKVRLYFAPNFGGSGHPDYHWYRQDSNGGWSSSKHGWEPVGPQLPNTNAVNKDANGWGYGVFCGTMCVASH